MYRRNVHKWIILIGILTCIFSLTACGKTQEVAVREETGGFIKIAPGAYDSADQAIVIKKQESQNKITFFNLQKKKNYTLSYDGTTKFQDKYGTPISVAQLKEGEVAEVLFLKEEKMLSSLSISSEIWTLNDIGKFELDLSSGRMKIMNEYYTLDEHTVVLSGREQKELIDINAQDILGIKGADHKIYSITIQEGHGYLRLINDEYFVGGWIEVGQNIIEKIEEDMLLTVPEGTHEVYLSHAGIEGIKEVKIVRNKETSLDLGDLKKDDLVKYGNLIFTVEPSSAEVFIDGKKIDITRVVKAEYGLHQIMAKLEGYETVIQYIRVNGTNANVSITLEEETQPAVSGNTTSSDTETSSNTGTSSNAGTSSDTAASDSAAISGNSTEAEKKEEKAEETKEETSKGSSDKQEIGKKPAAQEEQKKEISSSKTEISNAETATGYKIIIEEPQGAEVYVNGNYVGIAPASYKKQSGMQEITIRKNGFLTRTYTINVDDEAKDVSYSFSELTPQE